MGEIPNIPSKMREPIISLQEKTEDQEATAYCRVGPSRWKLESGGWGYLQATFEELKAHRADLEAAGGAFLVDLPEPGSDLAKVMRTNRVLKTRMRQITEKLEAALGFVQDIGPYPEAETLLRQAIRELND
jgi:hypothetical protein